MEAFRFQLEHGKLGLDAVVVALDVVDVVGVGKEKCGVSIDVGAAYGKVEYVAVVIVVAAVVVVAAAVVVVVVVAVVFVVVAAAEVVVVVVVVVVVAVAVVFVYLVFHLSDYYLQDFSFCLLPNKAIQ